MNVYSVNWNALTEMLLPLELRQLKVKLWLKALLTPLVALYVDFLQYRDRSLYKIRHNSQICYMEDMLNDQFDSSLRRIRIYNTVFREPIYFYEPEENRPVLFYNPADNRPVYFREPEDFAGEGVDFIVFVPPDLQPATEAAQLTLTTRISGQVTFFKLYSKDFKIVWEQVQD